MTHLQGAHSNKKTSPIVKWARFADLSVAENYWFSCSSIVSFALRDPNAPHKP